MYVGVEVCKGVDVGGVYDVVGVFGFDSNLVFW